MSRKLRALGLTVLALCGLTALMATSAQANWLENGVEVTVNKNVLAKAHTTGTLSVPTLNIEFRCTTLTQSGLKIVANKCDGRRKSGILWLHGFLERYRRCQAAILKASRSSRVASR